MGRRPECGGTDLAPMNRTNMIRRLRELIVALDRRVPQVQRVGERAIASDAAALRAKALERLAELQRDPAPPEGEA